MLTSLLLICCCVHRISAAQEPRSRSLLVVQQHLQGKVQVEELLDVQAFRVAPEAVLCRLRGLVAGQQLVKPLREEDSTSQAFKRCAVVSNSGVLLQHSHGAEIDASDRIFRFNDAVIGGNFSSNVGSREDIRVLNYGRGREMLNGSMSQAVGATYLFMRHQVEEEVSQVRSWAQQTSGPVWVGTQEVNTLAKEMLSFKEFTMFGGTGGGANPTTGTMGILIALSMCEEVRAYGFALTAASYVVPNHYYGEPYGTAAHGHCCAHASYFEEKDIWAHLSISPDTETTDVSVMPGFRHLATCTVDGRSPGSYLSAADAEVRPQVGGYVPFRTPPKLSVESAKAASIESLSEKFCNFSSLDAQDLYVASSSSSTERKVNYPLNRSKRCAVVSNSGAMLLHEYGAEIDASDLVFRFNDAEIGGELTANVGSRDDVRIMNRLTGAKLLAQDIPMVQDVVYVLSRHAPEENAKAPLNRAQREQLLFYAPSHWIGHSVVEQEALQMLFREFTAERVGSDNPTTGMLGVMLAMTMCDEVRAYGFPQTTGNQKAPFHYYGWQKNGRADRNFEHEGAGFEKELWRRVATNADVDATDVSVVPGFKQLNCSS